MAEYEVRAVDNSVTFRVEADSEQEAAERAAEVFPEGEAYVYPAELPVGWEGTDPEEPVDPEDARGPAPL
jgi:hypothetical protein